MDILFQTRKCRILFFMRGPRGNIILQGHQECMGKREPASPSSVAAHLFSPQPMPQSWAINMHGDHEALRNKIQVSVSGQSLKTKKVQLIITGKVREAIKGGLMCREL